MEESVIKMRKLLPSLSFIAGLLLAVPSVSAQVAAVTAEQDEAKPAGPLQKYLEKPDETYQWKKLREGEVGKAEYVELILQSQTWREIAWKHQLYIFKPANTSHCKQCVLYIGGGAWQDFLEEPDHKDRLTGRMVLLADLAHQLQTPVALLRQVPHQPILGGMYEDAIISFTFQQFLLTGEEDWPLLLPMVKSAVRGMDAVQEFCQQEWRLQVENFTVSGASKRGWTTWLVGAHDQRVNSIAPMVIDVLNMGPQMEHQLESWGAYSEEIGDYTARGLQRVLKTPPGRKLSEIVDPYAYRDSLQLPKIIINGTNDRYWPVDALNLYWDDLPGEKYALYVPNEGHGIGDKMRLLGAVAALQRHACGTEPLPKPAWIYEENQQTLSLTIESDKPMHSCQLWLAASDSRDFRNATWTVQDKQQGTNKSQFKIEKPATGYAAVFAELLYDAKPLPLSLSTNLRVLYAESK